MASGKAPGRQIKISVEVGSCICCVGRAQGTTRTGKVGGQGGMDSSVQIAWALPRSYLQSSGCPRYRTAMLALASKSVCGAV